MSELFIRDVWVDMKGILRATRQRINAELMPLGLSGLEGDLLFHLLTGSDGFQQERLAEQLDIGKAAISRAIDALASKGYVVRMRRQADRRAYSVCLTEKALAMGAQIEGVYDRLNAFVLQGISDEERLHIQALLARLAGNLNLGG